MQKKIKLSVTDVIANFSKLNAFLDSKSMGKLFGGGDDTIKPYNKSVYPNYAESIRYEKAVIPYIKAIQLT
ncbi:MAG: hypothetical protein LBS50_07860 [Prevotellaceae bacterium]|jgi:hypothetical protein|nr:hypothetical protein [Prevotellaceae bacterium]